ncbi:MAG: translation elongation factor Ts, partial [Minisyncoccia bacterium]
TEMIKELRDTTGVSVMQCKKALEESNGDIETAMILLRKQSSLSAAKKAERTLAAGLVNTKESNDKTAVVTLLCETDFVAKNDDFVSLVNTLTDLALSEGADAVLAKAKDLIDPLVQKIGENIQLGKVEVFTGSVVGLYNHNGKNAAVVILEGGNKDLARDIAMHVSAMYPRFKTKEEISEEDKAKVTELFTAEVNESDKPEEMKTKILQGKLDTYFKEYTLVEQNFIKDPSKTIGQLLKEANASIVSFNQFTV